MKIKESYKKNWAPYLWAMPDITIYQIVSNVIYFVLIFAFEALAMFLIRSTGHMAISSGDYTFLFKTWQGPLLIFISLAAGSTVMCLITLALIVIYGTVLSLIIRKK